MDSLASIHTVTRFCSAELLLNMSEIGILIILYLIRLHNITEKAKQPYMGNREIGVGIGVEKQLTLKKADIISSDTACGFSGRALILHIPVSYGPFIHSLSSISGYSAICSTNLS